MRAERFEERPPENMVLVAETPLQVHAPLGGVLRRGVEVPRPDDPLLDQGPETFGFALSRPT